MSSTGGDTPDGPGPAGWYPDPRHPGRRRYWDGDRWSELSASTGSTASRGPTATAEPDADLGPNAGRAGPGGRCTTPDASVGPDGLRRGPLRWAVLALAVSVALLALGWWVLGRDDRGTDSASPTTGSSDLTTSTAVGSGEAGSPTTTGVTDPTAAAGPTEVTGADGTAAIPSDPGGVELTPCTVASSDLLSLLRSQPSLASFADSLLIDDVRCVGDWATAVVSAPDTDSALAVYRREGSGWTFLLVGSAEPCAGLGVPAEVQAMVGCDFGSP